MTNDCRRCGRPTEADFIVLTDIHGLDGYLCDSCRESLREWYDGAKKPPVRGGCSQCGGNVEVSFRFQGDRLKAVFNCPTCGWTKAIQGDE